jgi:hypothetical protein
MECNYKSAKWYGEKHPEPEQKKIQLILALKKSGRYKTNGWDPSKPNQGPKVFPNVDKITLFHLL